MRVLLILALAMSAGAQQVRTVNVAVVLKPQGRGIWSVTLDNQSALPIQISRARILANAPSVSQLTKAQIAAHETNSPWGVAGRTVQEVLILAPAGLSAAGLAKNSATLGWAGLGMAVGAYFVSRAVARSQTATDELPDIIPLAAGGGAEYRLHCAKGPKGQPPVSIVLTVIAP